jgi:hypothetical protein
MESVTKIIESLEQTPDLLKGLLKDIPSNLYEVRRLENKWSIHEQVCHLVDAQAILKRRFQIFEKETRPYIPSHDPMAGSTPDYAAMNMRQQLDRFPRIRQELVNMLKKYRESYWDKKGEHEAFTPYSSKILLRHTLLVDHAHLFSIEQLGLTKDEFVDQILVVP